MLRYCLAKGSIKKQSLLTKNRNKKSWVFYFSRFLIIFAKKTLSDFDVILGTLSKDNDDGSENVGKIMNLRSFKLNRVFVEPLNMSNAGDFSWS